MFRLCEWLVVSGLILVPGLAHADSFDNYTNPFLSQLARSANVEKLQKLTTDKMLEHTQVLPSVPGIFLVVKTNDGRWSKLLLQTARQKVSAEKSVPILLIERYVTFREGETRTIQATGQNVRLFGDFRFSLDFGQVVPAELGGDIGFMVGKDGDYVEVLDKAEMYLVTKHLAEADPKRAPRPSAGAAFEPHFFLGAYKLYDDGRRSGELHLKKLTDKGEVTGVFYSDQGGKEYDVEGKIGVPSPYAIQFKVFYPQAFQTFEGLMFTGDGRAITGTSSLQQRETGFYAVRIEDKMK